MKNTHLFVCFFELICSVLYSKYASLSSLSSIRGRFANWFLKLLINRSQFVFGWGRNAFLDRWWQKEEEETEPQGHPGNTTITFLIQGMAKLKINK